jgi:hypothetical protein
LLVRSTLTSLERLLGSGVNWSFRPIAVCQFLEMVTAKAPYRCIPLCDLAERIAAVHWTQALNGSDGVEPAGDQVTAAPLIEVVGRPDRPCMSTHCAWRLAVVAQHGMLPQL